MVLGDSDLKQINGRVSKIYKKVVGKRELLKKNLDSSGKYLDEALDKLCMLKNTLDEIRPFSKSEDTYKPYKQYVKVMRNSLSSMLEEFDSGMKLKTTGFLKEFLLKYTHFFHHLLFGDKENLIKVFSRLVSDPGYLKHGTFTSSFDTLTSCKKPGSYIFRISTRRLGFWSIAYVSSSLEILQALCYDWSIIFSLNYGHQQGLYLYPRGKNCADDFSDLCGKIVPSSQTSSEEKCLRCGANSSNTRMEPCGHSCCRACYKEILEPPLPSNEPHRGRNQEFNNAVERVLTHCSSERVTVEANLRILNLDYNLSDSVKALIQSHGDREAAIEFLKQGLIA
ncbi:unnamed protein product [Hymenolepis diminuta]|uniref:E3 ubiquitin-protein ligase CBL n=1 Tax=Hymenolepis diminuta TaxID=6216 RepID=A0A0R3SUR4_HYMDI|nr:unnamed protein product [Hymenolepis diminuta]